MAKYPSDLVRLIACIKKLPGVGTKTAERFAFKLLNWHPEDLALFSSALASIQHTITRCPLCHCLADAGVCPFCKSPARDASKLCIISSPKDAYAIEELGTYRGLYHVLGALLSPLDDISPEQIGIEALKKRVQHLQPAEIIIALDATLEADATSLFLKEELQQDCAHIFRLAFGIPMGSSLEFVDGGTLARSFAGRQQF